VTPELLWLAVFAFLCAGVIKGTVGIGLPTVTISIKAQATDPRIPIALLLIPALITNTWQVARGGQVVRSFRILWPLAGTMFVFLFVSARYAAVAATDTLVIGIGAVVVLWTLTSLIRSPPAIPDHLDRPMQFIAGAVGGVIGGLTAIWSPPMVMYLLARRVDKDDFLRFTGFIIIAGTIPLTAGYLSTGLLTRELAIYSVLMIIPTLGGYALGERLRGRLDREQFQKVVLVVFCVMGLNLIRKALVQ